LKLRPSRLSLARAGLAAAVLLASAAVYAANDAYADGSASLAADGEQAFGAIQYAQIPYPDAEARAADPVTRVNDSGQLGYEMAAAEQESVADAPHDDNTTGPGIGMGVAPLFDNYGVIRAGAGHENSAYVALGFSADRWTMEAADTPDNLDKNAFSYGFGVNGSSSNFEYMMSVDQENNGVAAIGLRFTSAF